MLTGLIYIYIYICVCVCVCVCVDTVNDVFIYRTQNGKLLCDIVRKFGTIFLHSSLRPVFKLNTNSPLNLTLPATHLPAAVLVLLT